MANLNIVILGFTGNLAEVKLIPALFELWKNNEIPQDVNIYALSHRNRSEEELKTILKRSLRTKKIEFDEIIFNRLWKRFTFIFGDFNESKIFAELKIKLSNTGNTIYYLATHPDLYQKIFVNLEKEKLNINGEYSTKIMVEKPIGYDFKSAHELNQLLAKYYKETQIFRIDHYLAKETIQNILAFRFHNEVFESTWNNKKIDHIQILVAESFGAESRNAYYDTVGALKDVGQNHILQMLAFTVMDRPISFDQKGIVDKRKNVFKNLIADPSSLVLGQYENYSKEVCKTNTFFAFKTMLRRGKLKRVPIYVRAGKKLKKTVAEISVVFKSNLVDDANVLTFRIQPNEGIVFKMAVKKPGFEMKCEEGKMQFCYKQIGKLKEAYLRLLIDAINNEHTYFNDSQEVEFEWKFIDDLIKNQPKIIKYNDGSWGPKEADEMIEKDGRAWLEPSEDLCRV